MDHKNNGGGGLWNLAGAPSDWRSMEKAKFAEFFLPGKVVKVDPVGLSLGKTASELTIFKNIKDDVIPSYLLFTTRSPFGKDVNLS